MRITRDLIYTLLALTLISAVLTCPMRRPAEQAAQESFPENFKEARTRKQATSSKRTPKIGIFTQPAKRGYRKFGFQSIIAASYAKWVEQFGAIIVPIPYTLEKDEIAVLLRQLNGLILPGGGTTVFKETFFEFYRQRVYFALDTAKQINEEGIHFPVWGICMGLQQIIMWASGYTTGATEVRNQTINRRIHWDYKNLEHTVFASHLSGKDLEDIQNHPICYFNNNWAVSRKNFERNAHQREVQLPVSYTYPIEGEEFLSTVQGVKWPIIGTQYHPEKVQFEHVKANEGMDIGVLAVYAAKKMGLAFVNETKKNTQTFKCEKLLKKLLIQNFRHTYTDSTFESIYFFHEVELSYADVMLEKDGC